MGLPMQCVLPGRVRDNGRTMLCTRVCSPAATVLGRNTLCSVNRTFTAPRMTKHTVKTSAATMAAGHKKTVLVPIAEGSEEMEAVITINVLRRAGAEVTVASCAPSLQVTCARGVKVVADALIEDVENQHFDLIACPGGMPGAEHLRDCAPLERMMRSQRDAGKLYAAICASPVVFLQSKGLSEGRKITAHPAFADKIHDQSSAEQRVVVDGNLTTSRGPGTTFEFALSLVKQLYGEEAMKKVAGPMVMYPYHV